MWARGRLQTPGDPPPFLPAAPVAARTAPTPVPMQASRLRRLARRWIPALASLAVLSACRGRAATAPSSAADSLYVGVAAARANTDYFRGVQMALDRLNAERPKGARPLALRFPIDSQTSQVAVAAAFRDDPTVIGVVGHTGSAQTMDAAPIYGDVEEHERRAVLAITPTATNPAVTRGGRWVFRVCPTDDDAARALARFAIDSAHARRVGIIYRNDLFGRGFTRVIAPALQQAGAAVLERDPYLAGLTEYDAYAARLARRKVDVLVVAGGGVDAADMIRALRRAGAAPTILGSDDIATIATAAKTPGEFRGVRYTAFYDAASHAPAAAAFAAEFRRRYGTLPTHQSALSYDAAMLIGRAAQTVGNDRRAVRDWVAAVGRSSPAYDGVTGQIRFDEHGDALSKMVLIGEVKP